MNDEYEMNAESICAAQGGTAEAQNFWSRFARQTLLEPVLFSTDSCASTRYACMYLHSR